MKRYEREVINCQIGHWALGIALVGVVGLGVSGCGKSGGVMGSHEPSVVQHAKPKPPTPPLDTTPPSSTIAATPVSPIQGTLSSIRVSGTSTDNAAVRTIAMSIRWDNPSWNPAQSGYYYWTGATWILSFTDVWFTPDSTSGLLTARATYTELGPPIWSADRIFRIKVRATDNMDNVETPPAEILWPDATQTQ